MSALYSSAKALDIRAEMDRAVFSKLNQRQRECLRLVYRNLEAKEIARELGLSPHTVVEHLRDARHILGASRSMHAARLLVEHEGGDNRIVSDPVGVVSDRPDGMSVVVPDASMGDAPGARKDRYQYGYLERLGMIVGIAVGIVALTGSVALGAHVVTQLISAHHIDLSDQRHKQ